LIKPNVSPVASCGNGKCEKGEDAKNCAIDCTKPTSNQTAPPETREIISAYVEGNPRTIISNGDLWMNTWADDGNLYSGWGDGNGFGSTWTDFGIAKLIGNLPQLTGENIFADQWPPPGSTSGDKGSVNNEYNDKVSSLLFMNGKLYAQIHSPLGDPLVGYLTVSNDYGRTWIRYKEQSPWISTTAGSKTNTAAGSNFRCMFFINMGKNYELNSDGYVYAFGIGREWGWFEGVYLAKVLEENIMDYNSYEYFTGLNGNNPQWSNSEADAVAVEGLTAPAQFSAIYHPGTGKYIIMNEQNIYDAPNPWGPWKLTSNWVNDGWRGYQPGIISKDTGENYFWFTIAGNPEIGNDVSYQLNLGKIVLDLA